MKAKMLQQMKFPQPKSKKTDCTFRNSGRIETGSPRAAPYFVWCTDLLGYQKPVRYRRHKGLLHETDRRAWESGCQILWQPP